MSAAREAILARVRRSLTDVPISETPAAVAVPREYRHQSAAGRDALVTEFAAAVSEYRATVRTVASGELARHIALACADRELHRLVVPAGVPEEWRPPGVEIVEDDGLTAAELDRLDGALTGCAAAIAQTGTLVLDGRGACGRRAITLVPDHHICVVRPEQIVGLVPEAIARLADAVRMERAPITLISGPSATSDIELTRVEGVHGPRNLLVLIAD